MPHTSRKKKQPRAKRQEYTDEDGWTRISSSPRPKDSNITKSKTSNDQNITEPNTIRESVESHIVQVSSDITLAKITARYGALREKWLGSESWRTLKDGLAARALQDTKITACVLLGTGSYSGARDGWIERHDVALLQTAVYIAVVEILEQVQGLRPKCYAQEPRYNDLDTEFLMYLQITKVDNPDAFGFIGTSSFVYFPGGELDVEMRSLYHSPAITIAGNFDDFWRDEKGIAHTDRMQWFSRVGSEDTISEFTEGHRIEPNEEQQSEVENYCRIREKFLQNHESIRIPDLEMKDYPFHNQWLYWPKCEDTDS